MPNFQLAWHTRRGAGPVHDGVDFVGTTGSPLAAPVTAPAWIALAACVSIPADFAARHRAATRAGTPSGASPQAVLRTLAPDVCLSIFLNPAGLTLTCAAAVEVAARRDPPLHYFRLADGTVKPLPSDPSPLTLAAGDTYLALTPGVRRVTDSPAVARFIHLHDDFNAHELAQAVLDHLLELAGTTELQEDITALVVEAR